MIRPVACTLCGLLILLSACSTPDSQPSIGASDFALPQPLPHTATAAGTTCLGRDGVNRSPNTYVLANWLYLPIHERATSWAVYQLTPEDETPVGVQVEVDTARTTSAWVAVADWSTGAWSLHGPFAAAEFGGTIYAPAPVSPDNQVSVAVLTHADQRALIRRVSLVKRTPPVAAFSSQGSGFGPQVFDASASTFEGTVTYEWDIDGDGDFETSVPVPQVTAILPSDARTVVTLRVVDDAGLSDTASHIYSTSRKWLAGTVVEVGPLIVAGGFPALAYSRQVSGKERLIYKRAFGLDGLAHWSSEINLDPECYGSQTWPTINLAIVNGMPAVAYRAYDEELERYELRYQRANDANGNEWHTPTLIASLDNSNILLLGEYCLREVEGRPAVAFFRSDNGNSAPLYLRADNAEGTAWGTPLQLGPQHCRGKGGHLFVANGVPNLVFLESSGTSGSAIWSVTAQDALGAAWDAPVLAVPPATDHFRSIALASGLPRFANGDFNADSKSVLQFVMVDQAGQWQAPQELFRVPPGPQVTNPLTLRVDSQPSDKQLWLLYEIGRTLWTLPGSLDGLNFGAPVALAEDLYEFTGGARAYPVADGVGIVYRANNGAELFYDYVPPEN